MSKEKERDAALYYYVEKGMSAKEAAARARVSERTMSTWVKKYGWKSQREAMALSPGERTRNIEELLSDIAGQRIELSQQLRDAIASGDPKTATELRRQIAAVDDGASKWNKRLEGAKKEAKIHLSTYLYIMERVFDALRRFDPDLYIKTLPFQEHHVREASTR